MIIIQSEILMYNVHYIEWFAADRVLLYCKQA